MPKRLFIREPFRVGYEEFVLPAPLARQVHCRSVIGGISHGTEMTAFAGTSPFVTKMFTGRRVFEPIAEPWLAFYPFRYVGYDTVGVVTSIGSEVRNCKFGDRIWAATQHATHFVITEGESEAFVLPPSIRDEEAIMLNLASIALTATNDAEIKLRRYCGSEWRRRGGAIGCADGTAERRSQGVFG